MSKFLDDDYEVPEKESGYMKFVEGQNRFRILCSPIIGWEIWRDQKPIRHRMDEAFSTNDVDDPKQIKHFWAMAVYNYSEERIQILEITQKSIQKSIKALSRDTDWGSPLQYDIVVTRTGKQLVDTEYEVQPKPAKKIDEGILQTFEDMHIHLEALYDGKDPFAEDIVEDAVKALG